jgi:plasmid stability protein
MEETRRNPSGMAILNIKNFPDELYERLKERAREERRSVSQQVIILLEHALLVQMEDARGTPPKDKPNER